MASPMRKPPELRNPSMVAAWPGMGHVGLGAIGYLKEMLKAEEIGGLELPELFDLPGVYIDKGLAKLPRFPESKFFFWKNEKAENDLVIFLGESQPSRKGYDYASRVLDVAQELHVTRIYTCAAAPSTIRHKQRPRVLAVANNPELVNYVKDFNITIMGDGSISGMNGLLLGVAAERDIGGICLLGQLPYYTVAIPNPRSSQAVLDVLCKMLGIEINMRDMEFLVKEADEEIDQFVKSSEQMEEMMGHLPAGARQIEEDRALGEKASSLADENRIRRRIEKMFEQTEKDRSKAHELKAELDQHDLFKEYEDRFLDLFRKENQ